MCNLNLLQCLQKHIAYKTMYYFIAQEVYVSYQKMKKIMKIWNVFVNLTSSK